MSESSDNTRVTSDDMLMYSEILNLVRLLHPGLSGVMAIDASLASSAVMLSLHVSMSFTA